MYIYIHTNKNTHNTYIYIYIYNGLCAKDEAMTHIAVERGRGLDGEVGAALLRHNVERREVLPEHAVGGVAPRLEDHLVDLRVGCERASLVPVQGRPRVAEQAAAW